MDVHVGDFNDDKQPHDYSLMGIQRTRFIILTDRLGFVHSNNDHITWSTDGHGYRDIYHLFLSDD